MEGRIYIAGSYTMLKKTNCNPCKNNIDNDPHFSIKPPTWGICRTDYRRTINIGDYVFFVLPIHSELPQMIFAYLKVAEKISHYKAYNRFDLINKRMTGKTNPDGNIIVDKDGNYNIYDRNIHKDRFDEISKYYIIGDINESKYFSKKEIIKLSPIFMDILIKIFKLSGNRPYDILCRSGRRMNSSQVNDLLNWIKINI